MKHNLPDLLKKLIIEYDNQHICSYLNITSRPLNRWIDKNEVPHNYIFAIAPIIRLSLSPM